VGQIFLFYGFVLSPPICPGITEQYFFVQEELQHIRKKYVCDWILDEDNILRESVLQNLDLFVRS